MEINRVTADKMERQSTLFKLTASGSTEPCDICGRNQAICNEYSVPMPDDKKADDWLRLSGADFEPNVLYMAQMIFCPNCYCYFKLLSESQKEADFYQAKESLDRKTYANLLSYVNIHNRTRADMWKAISDGIDEEVARLEEEPQPGCEEKQAVIPEDEGLAF